MVGIVCNDDFNEIKSVPIEKEFHFGTLKNSYGVAFKRVENALEKKKISKKNFKVGGTITVFVDMEKKELLFSYNKKKLCDKINIPKCFLFYPAIAINVSGVILKTSFTFTK